MERDMDMDTDTEMDTNMDMDTNKDKDKDIDIFNCAEMPQRRTFRQSVRYWNIYI
jgi:hypothetical protein